MLHKLITNLGHHLPYNQWLFLLTAYEIGKGRWMPRLVVIEAAQLPAHGSNVSSLCSRLHTQGLIDVQTVPNGVNNGTIEVKLTPAAKALIRTAFETAQKAA
jgi:DNA-binding MarR family transcriptional regulator